MIRTSAKLYVVDGVTATLARHAKRLKIVSVTTAYMRVSQGWPVDDALKIPSTVVKHGHWRGGKPTRTYKAWESMRQRCYNPRHKSYARYGARGITVCERWEDYELFLADMGERPAGMTLERKDNNDTYHPTNCIWATPKTQANNRGNNVRINGVTPAQAAEVEGISYGAAYQRLKRGKMSDDTIEKIAKRFSDVLTNLSKK